MTSQANITVKMQCLCYFLILRLKDSLIFGARPLICNIASKKRKIHDRGDTSKNDSTFFANWIDRKLGVRIESLFPKRF